MCKSQLGISLYKKTVLLIIIPHSNINFGDSPVIFDVVGILITRPICQCYVINVHTLHTNNFPYENKNVFNVNRLFLTMKIELNAYNTFDES